MEHLHDRFVVFEASLRTREQVLLSAIIALDVARALGLLQEQAEEAKSAATARHELGQIVPQVVLLETVSAGAANTDLIMHVLLLLISYILVLDSHLSCISRRLKQSLGRVLQIRMMIAINRLFSGRAAALGS